MNWTPVSDGVVRVERSRHLLLITLNRPEARNAIDSRVAAALGAAVELLEHDQSLRAGILTGAGSVFCAGQDLKAFAAGEPLAPVEHPEWGFAGFVRHTKSKPIVAALNGPALGGGLEIALACDVIIASDTATLGLPEPKRGLFAAGGGVPRLMQQIPQKIAMRLALTGEPITSLLAARWGLVNEVVPEAEVLPTALDVARAIAANAPLAVQATKRLADATAFDSTWSPVPWPAIESEFTTVFTSEDAAEGSSAFIEKRPPEWAAR